MNMGGHPTVQYPSYIGPLNRTKQSARSLVLNAIAAILVRAHEVVAVAACDLPAPGNTLKDGSDSAQSPSECYQVVAVQDDLNFSNIHLPEGEQAISEFTNPRKTDQHPAIPYISAKAGQSRWASLYEANGGWHVLDSM
jgi:hypothetical protein